MKIAVLISGRGSNLQALIDACERLGRDDSVRVVVIRSNGRHFQAGADLAERTGDDLDIENRHEQADQHGVKADPIAQAELTKLAGRLGGVGHS